MSNTVTNISPWIKSTCAYCGVGCGIEARMEPDGTMSVRGDKEHPANYGRLCSKGLALGETVITDGRLKKPSIDGNTVSWNQAIQYIGDELSSIIDQHGPDSVALYVSGQLLTEDYYIANKFMKGYIGSANIDTNSRLCMSSSVAGHKRAFGTDTVPNTYVDLELSNLLILTGSNLAWCHPVLYQRIQAAKAVRPEMKVVVIDPRATDTCDIADLHLAIQPGTDVALFNGLLNYLDENNHLDQAYIDQYTEGFDAALTKARQDSGSDGVDYLALSRQIGVPIHYLETFFQWFAETDKVVTAYSQGVNQSSAGTDKVNAIINCHLATGRIGRVGSGPFSVTGQPNAMGGREVGGLANMLAAHMEFGNEAHYRLVSDFWNTDRLASTPGLRAVDMFDAVAEGKIKAIWIMATNPVVSLPNAAKVKQALEDCPLVIVSDCIADTDTTRCANVLLPAKGWSEKAGTVTNSERRISRQRTLIAHEPAHNSDNTIDAQSDWWILCQVALRMGFDGFHFGSEAEIFREYAEMTTLDNQGTRDLDLGALQHLSDKEYEQLAPQQWPLPEGSTLDTVNGEPLIQKRFFAEGNFYTASRKGQFIAVNYRQPQTAVSREYPMVLNTGRIRDQWHTMTRTGLATKLNAHKAEPYVQLNPQDARCFDLKAGDIALLHNQYGTAKARVSLSRDMNPGQLFMPIHWTDVESSDGKVCTIVSPEVDPISAQPEAKYTPVAIKPWIFHSESVLLTPHEIDTSTFDYWVKRRVDGGFVYYLAQEYREEQPTLVEHLNTLCQVNEDATSISFDSQSTRSYRRAVIVRDKMQYAFISAAHLQDTDHSWLDRLLTRDVDRDVHLSILQGQAVATLLSGKQVCACKQVGELTLINAIQQQGCHTVAAIGECTHAGTGCGSCIPEIKALINTHGDASIAQAI